MESLAEAAAEAERAAGNPTKEKGSIKKLREKIAKAEALIASATDLESLQRYEDALRSGKLGDVLKSAELV